MVNYSYFYHLHQVKSDVKTPASRMEVSRPEGDQVLFAGQSQQDWECMSQQNTVQLWFFSRRDRNAPRLQWGRRSTTDFQAKWWQLMLLFISLGQTFLLPQLTQCEHTHVVWWVPYPSKWTHLHMQCTASVSPCLRLPLPVVYVSQIYTIYYHYCTVYYIINIYNVMFMANLYNQMWPRKANAFNASLSGLNVDPFPMWLNDIMNILLKLVCCFSEDPCTHDAMQSCKTAKKKKIK